MKRIKLGIFFGRVSPEHEVLIISAEGIISNINTLPGFTPNSMYPKLWSVSRLNYKNLITDLVILGLNNKEIRA